jgi:hypothetical protein
MNMLRYHVVLFTIFFISLPVWGQIKRFPVTSPASAITISPSAVTLTPNAVVQFTATRTGNLPGDVSWSVNAGSIMNGSYIAPPAIPNVPIVVTASWQGLQATASVQMIQNMMIGNIRIIQTDRPDAKFSSLTVVPDKEIRFMAKQPNGIDIPVIWEISKDPSDTGPMGILVPGGGAPTPTVKYTITHVDAITPAAHTIVLKATPAVGSGYAPATLNLVVTPDVLIRCSRQDIKISPNCDVKDFNRLAGGAGELRSQPNANPEPISRSIASAINSAKTMTSGSVISAQLTGGANGFNCTNYDWKIAVQAEESAGIIVYDPADAGSGICDPDTGNFIIALPVHVLWADVFGYHQNLDPSRPSPTPPSDYKDCLGKPAPPTITPCDKNTSWILTHLYKVAPLYNRFIPPGNGQGSINFSGKGEVSFDVQADPAYKAGIGWFNVPIVFERGATGSNLNSLTFAAAYDFRWIKNPDLRDPDTGFRFIVRKPQVQVRSGIEVSPSHPGTGAAPGQSHDWNYVWGEIIRFPVAINFHDQPSSFTFYPVIGGEQGWHLASNLPQHDPIVRGVAGADGSFRWPFNTTHNFLGTTPIGFEVQYRVRELAYQEPFADFADLPPSSTPPPCPSKPGIVASVSGKGCIASEILSSRPRSFFKADTTVPLDPYIQFKVSVSRGSLPPDFWNVGWTYTLGLSFGNQLSSEH